MKKALIYSLILHVSVLLIALFLTKGKDKESTPFFAEIITPEELQRENFLRPPKTSPPKKDKIFKMPRLHKDTPPPKELSSVPSQSKIDQGALEPSIDNGSEQDSMHKDKIGPSTDTLSTDYGYGKKEEGITKQVLPEGHLSKSLRERLFDKDVIGKLAKKSSENSTRESGISFDVREIKYYGYLQRLKEKIEGIWRYPSEAAEKGIYGDLYIRFTIKKDGRLGAVELIRTSGHKILDDAALKALKDAEPFWPLPEEWGKEGFTITGHFVYSIYGIYVR